MRSERENCWLKRKKARFNKEGLGFWFSAARHLSRLKLNEFWSKLFRAFVILSRSSFVFAADSTTPTVRDSNCDIKLMPDLSWTNK